jgi:N terminal of Calcineurin-like phosphoesterase
MLLSAHSRLTIASYIPIYSQWINSPSPSNPAERRRIMSVTKPGTVRAGLVTLASGILLWGALEAAQRAADPVSRVRDASTSSATGMVFHDQNGNNRLDPGEPGIPDVLVTNGIDVVQTDAEGRYTLSVMDETIISIVKPAGYKVPVDRDNLPRFYYIHQPNGTPPELDLDYPGIDPTGLLPASIDFPLMPADESDQGPDDRR